MSDTLISALLLTGLVVLGIVLGRRARHWSWRGRGLVLALALAPPLISFVIILVAGVTGSAALGWIGGLMLMFSVPLMMLVLLGGLLGALLGLGRRAGPPPGPPSSPGAHPPPRKGITPLLLVILATGFGLWAGLAFGLR